MRDSLGEEKVEPAEAFAGDNPCVRSICHIMYGIRYYASHETFFTLSNVQ